MQPKWLEWTRKLQAIAQNGLTYSENPCDIERFKKVRAIAAEMMATYSNVERIWTVVRAGLTDIFVFAMNLSINPPLLYGRV